MRLPMTTTLLALALAGTASVAQQTPVNGLSGAPRAEPSAVSSASASASAPSARKSERLTLPPLQLPPALPRKNATPPLPSQQPVSPPTALQEEPPVKRAKPACTVKAPAQKMFFMTALEGSTRITFSRHSGRNCLMGASVEADWAVAVLDAESDAVELEISPNTGSARSTLLHVVTASQSFTFKVTQAASPTPEVTKQEETAPTSE